MSSIHDGIRKELQDKANAASEKLLNGSFKDFTEAKILVERRKAYLEAIEIVKNDSNNEGGADDD